MGIAPEISSRKRIRQLRAILAQLREETYAKVREFRHDRSEDLQTSPGDVMDVARSSAEVETNTSLIERTEERLRAIDEALARVERGTYGVCEDCGDEIPIERLKAVPFAAYCIDCQEKRQRGARGGSGVVTDPYSQRWTPPIEMEDPQNHSFRAERAEENATVISGSAFGLEEEPSGEPDAPKRRRGRPRKSAGR